MKTRRRVVNTIAFLTLSTMLMAAQMQMPASTPGTVSTMLPSCLLAQQPPGKISAVSEPAAELYRRALVLDCNSGPPWEGGNLPLPQADLELWLRTNK